MRDIDCQSCITPDFVGDEPYFCLDHENWYGSDGLMCPICEDEICYEHDRLLEEEE